MKKWMRLLAVILTLAILMSGCGLTEAGRQISTWMESLSYRNLYVYPYEEMEYQRPDLRSLEETLATVQQYGEAGEELSRVLDDILAFYEEYDRFYTNSYLANLHYCQNLEDIKWSEENRYCTENAPAVDALLEELYRSLAASPLREELESEEYFGADFFAAYDGDSLWSASFTELMEQEARLQTAYYDACGTASGENREELAEILVELVKLRYQIAREAGYERYLEFAYDFYYYRDFTPEQVQTYLLQIRENLVPLYRKLMTSDFYGNGISSCTEEQMMAYLKKTAQSMGGSTAEAFYVLEAGGLYDIAPGENKYNASFEVYLTSYYQPFIFLNPSETEYDCLTLAHEFGHFTNDYLCGGAYAGVDVSEVMSQGMEYMSLIYGGATEELTALKIADCLCTYVEQAAYASFEHQLYTLDPDNLTVEMLFELYEQVGREYGFDSWDWDSGSLVGITHFYTNPLYIIGYVVSNDAAFQMYQLERVKPGQGLEVYQTVLKRSDVGFLEFLEQVGLESPFASGRLNAVVEIVRTALNL